MAKTHGESGNTALIIIALVLTLMVSSVAKGNDQSPCCCDETSLKDFVFFLLREKLYGEVIAESHRFVFLFPDSRYREDVEIANGDAMAYGGDERGALEKYQSIISANPTSANVPLIRFKIAKLLASARMYQQSIPVFSELAKDANTPDSIRSDASKWLILSVMLQGEERTKVDMLIDQHLLSDEALVRKLEANFYQMEFKSPIVAGSLSAALPGAGQVYLGRGRDALVSFILNGLFIWGTSESFRKDRVGVGALLLTFEIGWYGGNIYTSVNGAHKLNRKKTEGFKNSYLHTLNLMIN